MITRPDTTVIKTPFRVNISQPYETKINMEHNELLFLFEQYYKNMSIWQVLARSVHITSALEFFLINGNIEQR